MADIIADTFHLKRGAIWQNRRGRRLTILDIYQDSGKAKISYKFLDGHNHRQCTAADFIERFSWVGTEKP